MTKAIALVRGFLADVDYSARLDNKLGYKVLSVCGVLLASLWSYGFYLSRT